ncbi:SDR family oxidoreductase [Fictibacillus nanhaiensis]|uniref:SDR family oxidoreductase n=1 Tax=Fictibacillus nanhaiensis TaxID=742169 RepID=UPI001C968311|nr:SDR family oxidoreductase [Fictibacillus nanhaiensis]MBY6036716.1 SDR family oxidoreductase [Fictibacillus nanhaiensis]
MNPLEGKTAIVTGASRLNGIGAATCIKLAEKGANIYFTTWDSYDRKMYGDSHESHSEALVGKIREFGVHAHFKEVDLAVPENISKLFDSVEEKLGSPHILVNNACFSQNHTWEDTTEEILDRHYEINIRATTLMSIEFAKRFSGKRGSIIHLTSGQSKGPMTGELAYAATKGAVDALTVTLAAELGPKGITVNAVNPGPTDTGWMTHAIGEHLLQKFPLGRIGKPDDAARLIAFLATPEGEWVTGQIIHSEGGFLRQ